VNLDMIAVVILILGLVLTVYCLFRLTASYRIVAHYIDTHAPSGEPIARENESE
jgi:hypothetical protein